MDAEIVHRVVDLKEGDATTLTLLAHEADRLLDRSVLLAYLGDKRVQFRHPFGQERRTQWGKRVSVDFLAPLMRLLTLSSTARSRRPCSAMQSTQARYRPERHAG